VAYSFAKSDLRYPDAETAAILGPLLDGVFFNWEAEAVSLEAGVGLGRERRSARGVTIALSAEVIALRTDPVEMDDPVQDTTVETHFERVAAGVGVPLGISAFGGDLRLKARVRHTRLGRDLAAPLDSKGFTDLRLALLSPWPGDRRLPFKAIGVAMTYTTASSFEGWSAGVILGR
jgi:hypothetical protein